MLNGQPTIALNAEQKMKALWLCMNQNPIAKKDIIWAKELGKKAVVDTNIPEEKMEIKQ